mmetsp:Transcript_3503/g.2076  ORF Transcript_3503/g.2076 Transcript_3503/m.2076 type:complete len:609 (+) Transcript_3503:2646-4472(+)
MFNIMLLIFKKLRQSLVLKFILTVGLTFIIGVSIWVYFNINFKNQNNIIMFAVFMLLISTATGYIFILFFVKRPIRGLINSVYRIAEGKYSRNIIDDKIDEIGRLAFVINEIGKKTAAREDELNRQRNEYQTLFEEVPCIVTVQDCNYKLVRYNRDFFEKFDPMLDDYCYHAYKGRSEKCEACPVERTFLDGQPHSSIETGVNKDNHLTYWIARTSPIKNAKGQIIAAMEMGLDITPRKHLEDKLEKTEKRYYEIFNNMPEPIFVVKRDTMTIIDCNENVRMVYGYNKEEVINEPFMNLFVDDKGYDERRIKKNERLNRISHVTKDGKNIVVDIRIVPTELPEQEIFLIVSDITKSIETENQLVQASKMATLGEMAAGVAHEINQPLTVIKTASSYFMRKIDQNEEIKHDVLYTMAGEIDSHVDRATKIIDHMRQFGRKSDMVMEKVNVNKVLIKGFEIFSQQLKLRNINVDWHLEDDIPEIIADPYRLEQVFVNLLINARDAIEEKWESVDYVKANKSITLSTESNSDSIIIEVDDTGMGIPDAIKDKIFEPFFTTKKAGQGTGLGLSISYGIVKDCGGDISVVSKKDEGVRFVIAFPRMIAFPRIG